MRIINKEVIRLGASPNSLSAPERKAFGAVAETRAYVVRRALDALGALDRATPGTAVLVAAEQAQASMRQSEADQPPQRPMPISPEVVQPPAADKAAGMVGSEDPASLIAVGELGYTRHSDVTATGQAAALRAQQAAAGWTGGQEIGHGSIETVPAANAPELDLNAHARYVNSLPDSNATPVDGSWPAQPAAANAVQAAQANVDNAYMAEGAAPRNDYGLAA